MRLTVVIATMGRPERLRTALASLLECAPPPSEVVVVDGDEHSTAKPVVDAFAERATGVDVIYRLVAPGLTRQRNAGIDAATGDVLVFADDDVTFGRPLFGALAEAYAEPGLAGATVRVVEPEDGRIGHVGSPLRRLLPDPGRPGTMTRYGYPRRIADPDTPLDVEFMYGCLMTARRELAERVRFDENLTGYALAEDEDFSYRLSRLGRLRYLPDVSVTHAGSGILGARERDFNRMLVENRAYLFRKNFQRTPVARIQFGLVIVLLVGHRLANRSWDGALGLAEGAVSAWRTR